LGGGGQDSEADRRPLHPSWVQEELPSRSCAPSGGSPRLPDPWRARIR